MTAAEAGAIALAFWPLWLALVVAVVVGRLERRPTRSPYAPPPDVADWRRRHHLEENRP